MLSEGSISANEPKVLQAMIVVLLRLDKPQNKNAIDCCIHCNITQWSTSNRLVRIGIFDVALTDNPSAQALLQGNLYKVSNEALLRCM